MAFFPEQIKFPDDNKMRRYFHLCVLIIQFLNILFECLSPLFSESIGDIIFGPDHHNEYNNNYQIITNLRFIKRFIVKE